MSDGFILSMTVVACIWGWVFGLASILLVEKIKDWRRDRRMKRHSLS